jgi:S1-C subfamily serine protease/rhodanese-related sulfurtransferase
MKRLLVGSALALAWIAAPLPGHALSVQEAILRAKPAVALITARIDAEVTINCGQGPTIVKPAPFIETGTGWFVDGRGYVVTNAHVVDPAHRLPAWVLHEIKKMAIDHGCVEPALRARGFMRGQRPDIEDQIRRDASARGLDTAKVDAKPQVTVLLSNSKILPAEVIKFSAPLLLTIAGEPAKDSGRDLALLRVPEGAYPALAVSTGSPKIGDAVHILGFPGVVLSHELLAQGSAAINASATNGFVSGIKQDAIGQDLVQTDAPAAHGNSGGPAIGADGIVLGVLTFVSLSSSGSVVQGFNFLIPAKDVLKFLADTPVQKPGESVFNGPWVAGVSALFNERWSTAAARIGEANKLLPNLIDVKNALAEAEEKVKNPPPRPFPWAWATFGVTLLSGGIYGGMWGRRWWKNRFRILPTAVIAAIEKGANPLLIDVRTQSDYETSPLKLPGSERVDPEEALAGRFTIDADKKQMVVAYCTSPEEQTSERVVHKLRAAGYTHARILKGGLGGWTNARLPVESKGHLPSIGLEIYKNLSLGDVERRKYRPSDVIFNEGDDAKGEAFVVHSGVVEIKKRFNGAERTLTKLPEGSLFGELGLFRKATRSASAIAVADTELLVLKYQRLEWLIRNRPEVTMEMLKRLSELVVATDQERPSSER